MRGKCKFQDSWLEEDDFRLWLRKGPDDYTAFCSLCKKNIELQHSGIFSIKCHEKGKKHKDIQSGLKSAKQQTLFAYSRGPRPSPTPSSGNKSTISASTSDIPSTSVSDPKCAWHNIPTTSSAPRLGDDNSEEAPRPSKFDKFLTSDCTTKAEILWSVFCTSSHSSLRNGETAVELFPKMFPDSPIAAQMHLHKDKLAYGITHGLGPHFYNSVSYLARKSGIFALSVDESLNKISQKEQLDVMINFWDGEVNKVQTRYLTSAFLQSSTAGDLLENLTKCIADAGLSLESLVQLATDGPNVNLKLIFDLNQHMKMTSISEKQILDIGTCSLHIVNNAYRTAHGKVDWEVNQFLRSLYQFFKDKPSRRGVYTRITGSSDFPHKFSAIRWTENTIVIQRALNMLPHLKKYVTEVEKKPPDSKNFSILKKFLIDPTFEAKLHFSKMMASELEEFLTIFQRNDPLLPFLHQEVFLLMKNLASKIVKKSLMDTMTTASRFKKLGLDPVEDKDNFKKVEDVDIGFGANFALKQVKNIDCTIFKRDCKQFVLGIVQKLMDKSPLNKRVVLGATCLSPSIMVSENLRNSRVKIAIEELILHNQLTPTEGDVVYKEFNKFCEHFKNELNLYSWKNRRLDEFLLS